MVLFGLVCGINFRRTERLAGDVSENVVQFDGTMIIKTIGR